MSISKSNEEKMQHLIKQMGRCYLCPFAFHRSNIVPYSGSIDAKVALVGEGPGKEEDDGGEAFIGPAGRDMTGVMTSYGIKRKDLFICNLLKCRPVLPYALKNNQTPGLAEVQNCFPYLWEQMKIVRPELIVLVGATAAKWVLNVGSVTMGESAGKKDKLETFGQNAMRWDCDYTIMWHPAAALHNPNNKKVVNQSMRDTFHRAKSYIK
jgi:DNA polymerase